VAARVYSRRLLTLPYTTPGSETAAVPAGRVWIVTNVTAVNRPGTVGSQAYAAIATGTLFAFFQTITAAAPSFSWEGRMPMAAGELLILGDLSGAWDMTASGYDLDAS
jgi:hypothetical protein